MRQATVKAKAIAVSDLMERDVQTCWLDDMLDVPARIMWDHDCGSVPAVDESDRVVGMITDRDICMATYTKGMALGALRALAAICEPRRSRATAATG